MFGWQGTARRGAAGCCAERAAGAVHARPLHIYHCDGGDHRCRRRQGTFCEMVFVQTTLHKVPADCVPERGLNTSRVMRAPRASGCGAAWRRRASTAVTLRSMPGATDRRRYQVSQIISQALTQQRVVWSHFARCRRCCRSRLMRRVGDQTIRATCCRALIILFVATTVALTGNGLEENSRKHAAAVRRCLRLYLGLLAGQGEVATLDATVAALSAPSSTAAGSMPDMAR